MIYIVLRVANIDSEDGGYVNAKIGETHCMSRDIEHIGRVVRMSVSGYRG